MHPDLQRRVQRYGWDYASKVYDRSWQSQIEPAQSRLLEHAGLEPGDRVLDIACGTGLVSIPAAETVAPDGHLVGTDLSDEMVAAADRRARENGLDNTEFDRQDAESLDVQDKSFDKALCSLGLMYVPEPRKAVAEMHRVLVPGGTAVAAVWGRRDRCGWASVFSIVDRRVKSDVCPLFFQLGTGGALSAAFNAAGFEDVRSDRFRTELAFESDAAACEAAFEGGPVAMAWKRIEENEKESAGEEYLDSIAEYRTNGRYAIPGEFVVVSGRRVAD